MVDLLTEARLRIGALREALQAGQREPVRTIETHVSWVLLAGDFAYKIKKPIRLPFLDFTTLERRAAFCADELRLNQTWAPEIYLDVVPIRQGRAGIGFGADGEVVEHAVRMRRFPSGTLWSERIMTGALLPHHVDALAVRLAEVHRAAPVPHQGSCFGGAASRRLVTQRMIDGIDAWQADASSPAPDWPALRSWLKQKCEKLSPLWEARCAAGAVRECHGDLHLGNILQLGSVPSAFDALEFDPRLRWIDVLDDVAFAVMDLIARGRRDLGARLLAGYLDASGQHAGVPTLRFYLVSRALVRAQVAAIDEAADRATVGGGSANAYLRLAADLARHDAPRLAITHGLPGSGKTFVSQGLLEAAGALRLRSDIERKRLAAAAVGRGEEGPGGLYGSASSARTYDALHDLARQALQAGWPTIVDAAFLRRDERQRFAELARSLGVPFTIIDCSGPLSLLRERIEARRRRGTDASDADAAVLDQLSLLAEPLDCAERERRLVVDAERPAPPATLAQHWLDSASPHPASIRPAA